MRQIGRPSALAIPTLLLFLAAAAWSQSRASTVVGAVSPIGESDPSIAPILVEFLRLDLALRGIRFLDSPVDAEGGAEALYEEAEDAGAAYAVEATYQDQKEEIELSLVLYDAQTRTRVSGATARGRIDLSLNEVVDRAVDRVLEGIVLAPDPLDVAAPAGATATTGTTVETPSGTSEGESASVATTAQTAGVTPAVVTPSTPTPFPPAPAARFRYIGLSTGAAPLILTGGTAEFAQLGFLSTLSFHVRIPAGRGAVGLGVLSGFAWVRATGVVATADVSLVPIAADVVYTPLDDLLLGITLHASGGVAIMIIETEHLGRLAKPVPFALAGMQVGIPLFAALRVEIQASFAAFLESSLPILAFAPEVLLWLRL